MKIPPTLSSPNPSTNPTLNPVPNPSPPIPQTNITTNSSSETSSSAETNSTSASPTKKVLVATRGLLDRLSKLLVKFVHRIFPWNRRARRRLRGDDEEEDL